MAIKLTMESPIGESRRTAINRISPGPNRERPVKPPWLIGRCIGTRLAGNDLTSKCRGIRLLRNFFTDWYCVGDQF
jgi:hypothetical protein